jgi:glycosyltransferase involved in cell wall biosynthesis
MLVHYFQRRRRDSNFSLEFIFDDVRARLASHIDTKVVVAPTWSNGVARRVWITAHAAANAGPVNHVTGDITFAALGLPATSTVLTVLDCGNVVNNSGLKRKVLKSLWLDWPVAHCPIVTTISDSARDDIIALTGCDPKKVVVVPVAISERFTSAPREFFSERPRVLTVGAAPNKNLHRVVEALAGLECTLVTVGSLGPELHDLIQQRAVQHEAHVGLSPDQVVRLYESSDLVLFPSTHEGFGMPILEAQAVGRPVITSNVSSMPSVAGRGALLVDPYDTGSIRAAVKRVFSEPALRAELVGLGASNAKRFDGNIIARSYLDIYRQVESSR